MKRSFATPELTLVTGAANGLGYEIAQLIMSAGGRVIAIDNDGRKLQQLKDQFPQFCQTIQSDLSDPAAIDNLMVQITEHTRQYGAINLVLFNAAISATGRFEKLPAQIHQRIFNLNALSPMLMGTALMRDRMMAKASAMVFIASLSHQTGYPGAATYAASKDAIAIYAKSVRQSFGSHKINVMRVFPGPIRTAMAERHSPQNSRPERRMPPGKMARRILQAASTGQSVLYPDILTRLTAGIATVMPRTITKIMRKIIFEKLDKETY